MPWKYLLTYAFLLSTASFAAPAPTASLPAEVALAKERAAQAKHRPLRALFNAVLTNNPFKGIQYVGAFKPTVSETHSKTEGERDKYTTNCLMNYGIVTGLFDSNLNCGDYNLNETIESTRNEFEGATTKVTMSVLDLTPAMNELSMEFTFEGKGISKLLEGRSTSVTANVSAEFSGCVGSTASKISQNTALDQIIDLLDKASFSKVYVGCTFDVKDVVVKEGGRGGSHVFPGTRAIFSDPPKPVSPIGLLKEGKTKIIFLPDGTITIDSAGPSIVKEKGDVGLSYPLRPIEKPKTNGSKSTGSQTSSHTSGSRGSGTKGKELPFTTAEPAMRNVSRDAAISAVIGLLDLLDEYRSKLVGVYGLDEVDRYPFIHTYIQTNAMVYLESIASVREVLGFLSPADLIGAISRINVAYTTLDVACDKIFKRPGVFDSELSTVVPDESHDVK